MTNTRAAMRPTPEGYYATAELDSILRLIWVPLHPGRSTALRSGTRRWLKTTFRSATAASEMLEALNCQGLIVPPTPGEYLTEGADDEM